MSQKVNNKQRLEAERLEAFQVEQKEKRKEVVKKAFIIVVCVGLVFAFCLPAMSMLVGH